MPLTCAVLEQYSECSVYAAHEFVLFDACSESVGCVACSQTWTIAVHLFEF